MVACQRGLEALIKEGGIINPDSREDILKFDEMDARREANRLVSLLRTEDPWSYFVTATCNDTATFGVAPIRRAIEKVAATTAADLDSLL